MISGPSSSMQSLPAYTLATCRLPCKVAPGYSESLGIYTPWTVATYKEPSKVALKNYFLSQHRIYEKE
jgi:hypothetical protein